MPEDIMGPFHVRVRSVFDGGPSIRERVTYPTIYGTRGYEYVIDPKSGQFKAPFNHMYNDEHVFTYEDTAVVTPNSDTPYSMSWLDLRAEPIVISVPAVEKKRYYSVQLVDGNAYNYGYIGSRATGNDAGNYLVAGPDWQPESGLSVKN